jgi:uncharacterized integral membrane protein (TIGR00698 family)
VFLALLVFVAIPSPWASPPIALALGIAFGMTLPHPFAARSRKLSKWLLQAAVVALGFAMNLDEVIRAGSSGFVYTLAGIAGALAIGTALARLLSVPAKAGYLISVGTAICGGSAIAAVAPVVEAGNEEMAVSIGTVFVLNAVGLIVFPVLGHALALTQPQFGLWAALAIHDTSSVVGASAKYGAEALAIATTVKLARALWIVPVTLITAAVRSRRTDHPGAGPRPKIQWPWFIGLFVLAAVINTYVPAGSAIYPWFAKAGRIGLTITLFLIGTGMSRANLRKVGPRPLIQGIALWIIVGTTSLGLILAGWVAL